MVFTESPYDRSIEMLMISVPGFKSAGGGRRHKVSIEYTAEMCACKLCLYYKKRKCTAEKCPCLKERIIAGVVPISMVQMETMSAIHHPAFQARLKKYIKESEANPMIFKNEKHSAAFRGAVRKLDRKNNALMSAVYLLTADNKLWNHAKRYIERNEVRFDTMRPKDSTENGYTLYCTAKDLYCGTKHITVSDLADTDLISPKMFGLICNAMSIRRFGLGAIQFKSINNGGRET